MAGSHVGARRGLVGRGMRFLTVSLINVPLVQLAIYLLQILTTLHGWVANFLAVAAMTGPAYVVSKRWVWNRTGDVGTAPAVWFWTLSIGGLVISTATIFSLALVIDAIWLANLVNLLTYSSIFLLRFVLLERLLRQRCP